jgi:hypothetical protein
VALPAWKREKSLSALAQQFDVPANQIGPQADRNGKEKTNQLTSTDCQ